ncbi:MAG TPA: flagellar biosynthesis protein FlhB [Aeromonadales bacterium]|nr:flagellar biosynthesis protein FlhB [Aeromonadales bacterium]
MAEEDQAGERSEQATPKRQKDAREKGQVPRSRELTTASLLIFAGLGFIWTGPSIAQSFSNIATRNFSFQRNDFLSASWMMTALQSSVLEVFMALSFFFLFVYVAAAFSPVAIGGFSFSTSAMNFKGNRLSPAKGFKRMFGATAAMELIKSIAKFALVGVFSWMILSGIFDELLTLGMETIEQALPHGLKLVSYAFIGISSSLLIIAAIDIPFQLWNHSKQLKMTKQEIKDEFKDTEGKPEVKSKIRQQQREMSQRRMMAEVPNADVIITNPEHYSVALKYEDFGKKAPVVVAKGLDRIALKIREIAVAHNVTIVAAPPLARSIYHTTELNEEIPSGLYLAVAQVLAFVYRLNTYQKAGGVKPDLDDDIQIPDGLNY